MEPFFIKSMATDVLELTYTSGQMEELLNSYYGFLNDENNKTLMGFDL